MLGFDVINFQADSILFAGGWASGVPGLFKLNNDGTLDPTFNPNVSSAVNSAVLQPDGKIIIGGNFTSVAGTNINYAARLNGTNTPISGYQFLSIKSYPGMLMTGTVSNSYRIEWTTNLNTQALWTPLFDLTLQPNPQLIFDTSPIMSGQRFYRAIELP